MIDIELGPNIAGGKRKAGERSRGNGAVLAYVQPTFIRQGSGSQVPDEEPLDMEPEIPLPMQELFALDTPTGLCAFWFGSLA